MAEDSQTIDTIGVGLTLDTSQFDARLEASAKKAAAFEAQRTRVLRVPQALNVTPTFKVTQAQVRGLRVDINQHMAAMGARSEAVAVPVKLGASDWSGMRSQISQKIGTVPITVSVNANSASLRAGGRGAGARTADPVQVLAAWVAQSQGISLPTANNQIIRAARSKGITGRQHGGAVVQDRDYLVGEDGPEVVRFKRPATVIPRAQGGFTKPTPHYPRDPGHVRWCPQCQAAKRPNLWGPERMGYDDELDAYRERSFPRRAQGGPSKGGGLPRGYGAFFWHETPSGRIHDYSPGDRPPAWLRKGDPEREYTIGVGAQNRSGAGGTARFHLNSYGRLVPEDTIVEDAHRRKGLATAMYAKLERWSGRQITRGTVQSEDGRGLWDNPRRPFGRDDEGYMRGGRMRADGGHVNRQEDLDRKFGDRPGMWWNQKTRQYHYDHERETQEQYEKRNTDEANGWHQGWQRRTRGDVPPFESGQRQWSHTASSPDADDQIAKLKRMATQETQSPNEAAIAKSMLRKRGIPGYMRGGYMAGGRLDKYASTLEEWKRNLLTHARAIPRDVSESAAEWYQVARAQAMGDLADFGKDASMSNIGAFAAASPGQPWPNNRAILREILEKGMHSRATIRRNVPGFAQSVTATAPYGYDNWTKAADILRTGDLSSLKGPKVGPFFGNLSGQDPEAWTLDARQMRIASANKLTQAPGGGTWQREVLERAHEDIFPILQDMWGVKHRSQAQAILWSGYGRGEDTGNDFERTGTGIIIPRHPGIHVPLQGMRAEGGYCVSCRTRPRGGSAVHASTAQHRKSTAPHYSTKLARAPRFRYNLDPYAADDREFPVPEDWDPGEWGRERGGPITRTFRVGDPQGLHMRPSGALLRAAGMYSAQLSAQNVSNGQELGNPNSIYSWMTLGARKGHKIQVSAAGDDARAALDTVGKVIRFNPEKTGQSYADFHASLGLSNPLSKAWGRAKGGAVSALQSLFPNARVELDRFSGKALDEIVAAAQPLADRYPLTAHNMRAVAFSPDTQRAGTSTLVAQLRSSPFDVMPGFTTKGVGAGHRMLFQNRAARMAPDLRAALDKDLGGGASIGSIFAHEYGHAVDSTHGTSPRYLASMFDQGEAERGDLEAQDVARQRGLASLSKYAQSNRAEGFAELFSALERGHPKAAPFRALTPSLDNLAEAEQRVMRDGTPLGAWSPGRFPYRKAGGPLFKPVDAETFHSTVSAASQVVRPSGRRVGETVSTYPLEDYAHMRTYLDRERTAGYAVKDDGDLVSVFNVGGKGRGKSAIRSAIQRGATKLDAFDEAAPSFALGSVHPNDQQKNLPRFYGQFGFREVGRDAWNPDYAPEGWQGGTPDVVYMARLKALAKKRRGYATGGRMRRGELPKGYSISFHSGMVGTDHDFTDPPFWVRRPNADEDPTDRLMRQRGLTAVARDRHGDVAADVPFSLQQYSAVRDRYPVMGNHGQMFLHPEMTEVHPGHRGKGLASAIYATTERWAGREIMPSDIQTAFGQALWAQKDRPFGRSFGPRPLHLEAAVFDPAEAERELLWDRERNRQSRLGWHNHVPGRGGSSTRDLGVDDCAICGADKGWHGPQMAGKFIDPLDRLSKIMGGKPDDPSSWKALDAFRRTIMHRADGGEVERLVTRPFTADDMQSLEKTRRRQIDRLLKLGQGHSAAKYAAERLAVFRERGVPERFDEWPFPIGHQALNLLRMNAERVEYAGGAGEERLTDRILGALDHNLPKHMVEPGLSSLFHARETMRDSAVLGLGSEIAERARYQMLDELYDRRDSSRGPRLDGWDTVPVSGRMPIDGRNALGGSERGQGTYLVGELQPELFVPDRMRYIIPEDVMAKLPKRSTGGETRAKGAGVIEVGTRGPHLFTPPEDGWIIPHTLVGRVNPLIPRAAGGASTRKRYRPTKAEIADLRETTITALEESRAGRSGLIQQLSGRNPSSIATGIASNLFGGRRDTIEAASQLALAERRLTTFTNKYAGQIKYAGNLKADENNLNAKQLAQLRKLEPILQDYQAQTAEVATLTKAASPGLRAIAKNALASFAGFTAYGVASQGASALIAAATPQIQKWVDSLTGFTATNIRVTQGVGQTLRQNGGNADAAFGQIGLQTGLSSPATAFLQKTLAGAAYAKAGASAQGEKSDLFKASAANGRDSGLIGGYGGLGGGPAFAEYLGGGKGLAEQIGLDIKDLSAKTKPFSPAEAGAKLGIGNALGNAGFGIVAEALGISPSQTLGQIPGSPGEDQANRDRAAKALSAYTADINSSLKTGAHVLGQTAYELKQVDPTDLEKFKALGPEAADIAANGQALVDSTGKVVADQETYRKALGQIATGNTIGSPADYAKTQARSLGAQFQANEASRQFGETVSLGQQGLDLAANPFLAAGTGILPTNGYGTGASKGVDQAVRGQLGGIDAQQKQLTTEFDGYLADLVKTVRTQTPELGDQFESLVGKIKDVGQSIAAQQTIIGNAQANASAISFANNLRLATRAIKDAQALAGNKGAASSGGQLGGIQREEFFLQRAAQAISLELESRQVNFSIAQAGFTAPGMTGEERRGRIDEAKKEAELRKKQLGISYQLYDLGGREFAVSVKRAVQDAKASLAVIQANRDAELEIAAANKQIALDSKRMSVLQTKADGIISTAQSHFAGELSTAAGYVATFGGTIKDATTAIALATGIADPYAKQTSSNTSHSRTSNKATGFLGSFSTPTSFVAGEAGPEHVMVLRNPREGTMPATAGGGGGGVQILINIGNIGSKDDYPELERRLTRSVKEALGREATLLGLRRAI